MDEELERMIIRLIGDGSSYSKMLKSAVSETGFAAKAVEGAGKRIEGIRQNLESVGKTIKAVGASTRQAGQVLSVGVTAPLLALGTVAVREFGNFDQAMTETFAKMGKQTPDTTRKMTDLAKSLSMGGEVAFSPTELAKGYEELASAGLDAERAMSALPAAAKFAQAGAFGMDVAVKQLTGSMAAYGYSAEEMDPTAYADKMLRFSDVLVGVANKTTTSVEYAAIAMATDAAQAAKDYGMSVEELGAVLGVFASKNIEAGEAGNMTGRAMRLMTSQFVENRELWEGKGIKLENPETGNWVQFADAIEMLEKALEGVHGPARTAMLDQLGFEALAQKSILPLIGQSKAMREQASLYRKSGTTADMAAIQMESFWNSLAPTTNALRVLAIEMGEALAPALLTVSGYVRSGVDSWRSLAPATKQIVMVVAALVAGIGPLLIGLGLLISLIGGAATGFAALLSPLLSWVVPIGAIVAGIVGIAVAVAKLSGFDLAGMWSKAGEGASRFANFVKGFVGNFRVNMGILLDWISTRWDAVWGGLTTVVSSVVETIKMTVASLFPSMTGLWEGVTAGAAAAWGGALEYVRGFFSFALGFVANFAENMNLLWGFLRENWRTVLSDVLGFVVTFATNMAQNVMVGVTILFRMWSAFGGWLVSMFKKLFSFEVVDAVLSGLIIIGTKVREWASAAWQVIKDTFSGKNSGAMDAFINKANEDIKKGGSNVNLMESFADIMKEEASGGGMTGGFKNPLADVQMESLKNMPKFNLAVDGVELPQFVMDQSQQAAGAATQAGAQIGADIQAGAGAGLSGEDRIRPAIAGEMKPMMPVSKPTSATTKPPDANLENIAKGIARLVELGEQKDDTEPVVLQRGGIRR